MYDLHSGLKPFSTHRKTNSQACCECLHVIKIDCQALGLDEITRSELAYVMNGKELKTQLTMGMAKKDGDMLILP